MRLLQAMILLGGGGVILGCAPQPSSKSFGWGLLLFGMQGASAPVHHAASHTKAKAAAPAKASEPAEPEPAVSAANQKLLGETLAAPAPASASKDLRPEGPKGKLTAAAFVGD